MVTFITELNNTNYDEFTKDGVVLVDIWANWCGPCKQIAPMIDDISIEFQDRAKIGKLDADDNSELVAKLSVRNIPTILIFKDGVVVEKTVGMISKEHLAELLNKHI